MNRLFLWLRMFVVPLALLGCSSARAMEDGHDKGPLGYQEELQRKVARLENQVDGLIVELNTTILMLRALGMKDLTGPLELTLRNGGNCIQQNWNLVRLTVNERVGVMVVMGADNAPNAQPLPQQNQDEPDPDRLAEQMEQKMMIEE